MNAIAKFQVGKNGITDGVIVALSLVFKTHTQVRVSMLKSSGRDRTTTALLAKEMTEKLASINKDSNFDYKMIGFTVILRKYPK